MAPLHNPPNVKGYRAARALLPGVPHVAVFDTSFHQTHARRRLPLRPALRALPAPRHPPLRLPRHVAPLRLAPPRRAPRSRPDDPELRLITCHLGNGCSVAAIKGGRSIDTSMGFTPLEGLVMGTRCGDLDPGDPPPRHGASEELAPAELNALLNKHSGLLGHLRPQQRHARAARGRGRRATSARRPGRSTCSATACASTSRPTWARWAASTRWPSREGSARTRPPSARRALRAWMRWAWSLDAGRERRGSAGPKPRSRRRGASARVFVVPTNEELLIARDTFAIVSGQVPA